MKRIAILCVFLIVLISQAFSSQPVREPFIELFVDGQPVLNGTEIDVEKGQHFTVIAQIKGGRADFVQYPDTYAELGDDAEIVSRGFNKLIYKVDDKQHKWGVINESVNFESDNKIKLEISSNLVNKHKADVYIPVDKVEESYIKVTIRTIWGYDDGTSVKTEESVAEAVIHLDIQGNTNEWFATPNVKAAGTKDQLVQEKLSAIQDSYSRIENLFTAFDFASIQGEIRNLQNTVSQLDERIQYIVANEPTQHSDIFFIGLPSDKAVNEVGDFNTLAEAWNELELLIVQQSHKLSEIEQLDDNIKRKEVLALIKPFIKWQESLPADAESLLQTYAKEIDWQQVNILTSFSFNPKEDRINNIERALADLHQFLDNRSENIPQEKQKINYALTRLKAVRIFDGMLMGFFSSLNFARWENTRT